MNKVFRFFGGFVLILVFISCGKDLFLFNIFGGLDEYKAPSKSDLAGIGSILYAGENPAFIEELENSPELLEHVAKTLNEELEEFRKASEEDAEKLASPKIQRAAVMLAEVELTKSGTGQFVEKINEMIRKALEGGAKAKTEDPYDILKKVFGADLKAEEPEKQEEEIEKMKDKLLSFKKSAEALAIYEKTMTKGNLKPNKDVPKEKIATFALIGGIVAYIMENLEKDSEGKDVSGEDDDKKAELMAKALFEGRGFPKYRPPEGATDLSADQVMRAMLGDEGAGIEKVVNEGFKLDLLKKFFEDAGK